jgi:hypothetical protein
MSHPKTDRNKLIVKLRNENPEKWSWRAIAKEFGFKSHNTAKEIYTTFEVKFRTPHK